MFIGPEIRKSLPDDQFTEKLNSTKLDGGKSFKQIVDNFLGKYKAENFVEIVENMLQAYQRLGSQMSSKLYIPSIFILTFSIELGSS